MSGLRSEKAPHVRDLVRHDGSTRVASKWPRLVGGAAILTGSLLVAAVGGIDRAEAAGTISGKVFRDYNSNGVMNTTPAIGRAVDVGVAGIEVRGFDSSGSLVGQTTTGVNGTYTLSVIGEATNQIRVEFSIPRSDPALAVLQSSFSTATGASGSSFGTSIQFATVGNSNVDYAVNVPGEYCQNNPNLVTCAAEMGVGSPSNVGAFTLSTSMNGFVDVEANNTRIGSSDDLGSVFGIGVDRSRNTFYGTYVRRHMEYGDAGAVNAIYRINTANPNTVTTFVTLPGTLPTHDSSLPVAGAIPYSGDTGVFDDVGRVGLGDVDVTPDGTTLLTVDMNEVAPKLYFVPIIGSGDAVMPGTVTSVAIPRPNDVGSATCPGMWHPMGLGLRGGRVLVGGVCGAENTVTPSTPRGVDPTQSTAFVLEYVGALDGTGSFSTIWGDSLGYERGCTYREGTRIVCDYSTSKAGDPYAADWAAWNEFPNLDAPDRYTNPSAGFGGSNPQAMLANIEIADNGDLVLGFRDRFQDQVKAGGYAYTLAYDPNYPAYPDPVFAYPRTIGTFAGGDIIRVCNTGASLLTESNGTCSGLAGSGTVDQSGTREYYFDAYPHFKDSDGVPLHPDTLTGSTASMPGHPGVWSTAFDVTGLGRQGVLSLGSCGVATGECRGSTSGYGSQNAGYDFGNLNGFNKGVGLADLEVMCDMAPAEIGDRVWRDLDGDGLQDPGEQPIAGVTVRLYDSSGALVSTAVTDARGQYRFSSVSNSLEVGEAYSIRLDKPEDYLTGGPLEGLGLTPVDSTTTVNGDSENAIDSDASVVSMYPRIAVPPLTAGGNDHTFDFGFVSLVGVGDSVWVDADGDGVRNQGEAPLEGVTVELLDENGDPARDALGNLVAPVTTDANGNYFFDGLLPGRYRTRFTPPAGYAATAMDASGAAAGLDSDADRQSGVTDVFTVSPTDGGDTSTDSNAATSARFVNRTISAGFVPTVSVGNLVWFDLDRDGVQDAGETGIEGVTLSITNSDGSAVSDVFGNRVTTTTTDANGNYLFENLPVGQYVVSASAPSGLVATVAGTGDTTVDSSTGSATSTELLTPGASDMRLDFGFVAPSVSVGDFVWFDLDRDGVQDAGETGIEGVTLSITNADGTPVTDVFGNSVTITTTDANGNYVFADLPIGQYKVTVTPPEGMIPTVSGSGTTATDSSTDTATSTELLTNGASDMTLDFGFVAPSVSVGDLVWLDVDRDGVQDGDEKGIAGVTLSITNTDGSAVTDVFGNPVTTMTTDANGKYLFENLPVGQYKVTVTPPEGMIPTVSGSGTTDSDSSTTTATSSDLLTDGASDMSLDFGFVVPRVSVGDYVWYDIDNGGVQERNEPPLAGVQLSITKADGSPVVDVFGNPVTTTVTDVDGKYSFDNLPPGQYTVTVTDPAGFEPTVANKGPSETDSSTRKATSAVLSQDGSRDATLDFGFWAPPAVVGSRVWNDLDRDGLQDIDEPGVGGVTLTLTLEDGSPVRGLDEVLVPPTVTDAQGNYLFSNLPLGQVYRVTITYPDGSKATLKTQGPDRENDSSTNSATSAKMTLSRRADLSLDFGLVIDDVVVSGCQCPELAPVNDSTPLVVDQRRLLKTGQPGWLNPFTMATPSKGATWVESSTRLWNPKTKTWSTSVATKQGTWSVIRGQVKFTPADGFKGLASLPFKVTDTAGKTAMADLYVAVDAELPRTGTNPNESTSVAFILCAVGAMLLVVRRRRTAG